MGLNHFQKLFVKDLKWTMEMWLDTQQTAIDKLEEYFKTQSDAELGANYKIREYVGQLERAMGRMKDNIQQFLNAINEEEYMETELKEQFPLLTYNPLSCRNCKHCLTLPVATKDGERTEYYCMYGTPAEGTEVVEKELSEIGYPVPEDSVFSTAFKEWMLFNKATRLQDCERYTKATDCCGYFESFTEEKENDEAE